MHDVIVCEEEFESASAVDCPAGVVVVAAPLDWSHERIPQNQIGNMVGTLLVASLPQD